ncbi:MAG TPA: fused MFS/spermidine synthase [Syntrophales bacterium]|nr:fused MFS/spermidine synthase [Syntrophales bacterium]
MTGIEKTAAATKGKMAMALLSSMVFVGALLLFGMEPLVGRLLTPYFGGAAHVWLTCLMFYQAMLLIGYLYAHLCAKKMGGWHLFLLAIPLINLPLSITASPDAHAPLVNILGILLLRVALPFIVLSTTAVVAQLWLYSSPLGAHREPYPLYAASNAGSLIALLGYTLVAEPLTGVRMQSLAWTGVYIAYAAVVAAAWFVLRPYAGREVNTPEPKEEAGRQEITIMTYVKWLLVSSLPSALLLAVTNFIALEVGSFPLTWVLPLALYLGSFIITFSTRGGVPRFLAVLWPELLLATFILYLWGPSHWLAIIGHLSVFFMICLVAHGTLYELRPRPALLTNFYLSIALGGWIGGALVSLIAPHVFKGLFEYPLLVLLLAVSLWWCRDRAFLPYPAGTHRFLATGGRVLIVVSMLSTIGMESWQSWKEPIKFRHRNFYGTYRIKDEASVDGLPGGLRKLLHGRTLHGAQLLDPAIRKTPISYFYLGGGIADVYQTTRAPKRIAVLGLGSGAVAAYTGKADKVTYYEIDPDNEKIARDWFTYLEDCSGRLSIIVGDGRLSMQKTDGGGRDYNIIHMDAFTGDGIPTHLLTKEAMEIYLKRLAEDGVILFHVSNRYYELRPMIKATSARLNLYGAINVPATKGELKYYQNASWCVVLARNPARLQALIDRGWVRLGKDDGLNESAPWTDDYINILAPLIENVRWHMERSDTNIFNLHAKPHN